MFTNSSSACRGKGVGIVGVGGKERRSGKNVGFYTYSFSITQRLGWKEENYILFSLAFQTHNFGN
jgi:hypothetical protein